MAMATSTEEFTLGTLRMEHTLIVYQDEGQILQIDLAGIARVMNRLSEVASITTAKAPELLSSLNTAHLDLGTLVTTVTYRIQHCKARLRREKARVLLDEVPRKLEDRKVTSSADLRAAIVEADPAVQAAQDTIDQLEAVLALLKTKREATEWAFTAIKRLLGDGQLRPGLAPAQTPGRLVVTPHTDTTPVGRGETAPSPTAVPKSTSGVKALFGAATY